MLRAAVDLETTGLSRGKDEIIEMAFIVFEEGFVETTKFVTYVKPLRGINPAAEKVNKISWDMVKNAPSPMQVRGAFLDWKSNILGNEKIELLGHNLCSFDRPFLDYFFGDISQDIFSHRMDDSMVLARALSQAGKLPVKKASLDALCEYFNIIRPDSHRAEYDARAALRLWEHLIGIVKGL